SEASRVDWCDGIDAATSGLGDMGTKGQPAGPAAATSRYVTWTDSDRRQSSGTSGAEIIERGIVAGECLSGRLLRSRSSACCRYDPHAKVDSLRCATGWSSHKSVVCFARDGRIFLPDGDFSGELAGMGTIEAEFYLGARGGTRAPSRFAITVVCVAEPRRLLVPSGRVVVGAHTIWSGGGGLRSCRTGAWEQCSPVRGVSCGTCTVCES